MNTNEPDKNNTDKPGWALSIGWMLQYRRMKKLAEAWEAEARKATGIYK